MKGKHDGQPDLMSGFRMRKVLRAGDGLYRQVTGMLVLGGISVPEAYWNYRPGYMIEPAGGDGLATSESELLGF